MVVPRNYSSCRYLLFCWQSPNEKSASRRCRQPPHIRGLYNFFDTFVKFKHFQTIPLVGSLDRVSPVSKLPSPQTLLQQKKDSVWRPLMQVAGWIWSTKDLADRFEFLPTGLARPV